MEPLDDQSMQHDNQLSPKIMDDLKATAPWVRFIGIVGIVIAILYFLFALMANNSIPSDGTGGIVGLMVAAVIMFALYLMLLQYGQNLSKFVATKDIKSLEQAFAKQRTFWLIVGIMMIILLIFMVIGVIAVLAMGDELFNFD